jgi:hypothetical protein
MMKWFIERLLSYYVCGIKIKIILIRRPLINQPIANKISEFAILRLVGSSQGKDKAQDTSRVNPGQEHHNHLQNQG